LIRKEKRKDNGKIFPMLEHQKEVLAHENEGYEGEKLVMAKNLQQQK
jgi:hypothetical protein